jgi:hypothetical protein
LDFYCEASQSSAALAEETENLIQKQPAVEQLKPVSIKRFAEQNILYNNNNLN